MNITVFSTVNVIRIINVRINLWFFVFWNFKLHVYVLNKHDTNFKHTVIWVVKTLYAWTILHFLGGRGSEGVEISDHAIGRLLKLSLLKIFCLWEFHRYNSERNTSAERTYYTKLIWVTTLLCLKTQFENTTQTKTLTLRK